MPILAEQELIVLVMDPNDEDTKMITGTLEKTGFQVRMCSQEKEVVELCRVSDPLLRLVIVNPETAGLRLVELLSRNPEVRFLVVGTENELDHLPAGGYGQNIRGRLRKPFRRTRLLGSVLEAVGSVRQTLSAGRF